jgi:adenylate cyclase
MQTLANRCPESQERQPIRPQVAGHMRPAHPPADVGGWGQEMSGEAPTPGEGQRPADPSQAAQAATACSDAFISYASQDAAIAEAVVEALERQGITCWIAPRNVTPGEFYADAIVRALTAARTFVLVLTENSVTSPHVLREVERTSAKRHPIISFRIGSVSLPPALEYFLSASHWLDAGASGIDAAFPRLVAAVQRLLAPKSAVEPAHQAAARAPAADLFPQPSAGMPARHPLSLPLIALVAVIAVIGAYLAIDKLWFAKPLASGRPIAAVAPTAAPAALAMPERSVAVLPFVNLSGDSKDSYLGDGISGEILSALSQLPGLKVIGRASSFQFRDRDVDAVKVGKTLSVHSLLTGTVQRAGDKLRISVELIDTTSGVQLWSQHFDRSFGNLFALEDDISNAVSATLAVKLGMAGQPLVHAATDNPHAHDLYLRAKELLYRSDEPSLNGAVNLFNQAIAADPNYAAAWAGLAYSYIALADAYRAPIDLLPAMKTAAEKAVTLDSTLAEGHAYLSYILTSYQRDFAAGERESEKALALSPGSADVQFFLGLNRIYTRQAASSQSAFQRAEKLDPLSPFIPFWQIWAAIALGDSATAVQRAQRTLAIEPTFFYSTDPLVLAYSSFSRWQDCIARFTSIQAGAGKRPDYKAAVCYAHVGNSTHARHMLAQLETAARQRYVDHANIAEIYVALGDNDAAFNALDQAYNDRSQPLALVWSNPEFAPLHDDARYRALMEKLYAGLMP